MIIFIYLYNCVLYIKINMKNKILLFYRFLLTYLEKFKNWFLLKEDHFFCFFKKYKKDFFIWFLFIAICMINLIFSVYTSTLFLKFVVGAFSSFFWILWYKWFFRLYNALISDLWEKKFFYSIAFLYILWAFFFIKYSNFNIISLMKKKVWVKLKNF